MDELRDELTRDLNTIAPTGVTSENEARVICHLLAAGWTKPPVVAPELDFSTWGDAQTIGEIGAARAQQPPSGAAVQLKEHTKKPEDRDPPYPKKNPNKPFWLLEHPDGSWLKTRGAFIGGSLDPHGVTFTRNAEEALWWGSYAEAHSAKCTRVIDLIWRKLKITEHVMISPNQQPPSEPAPAEWILVPREPTDSMIDAADDANADYRSSNLNPMASLGPEYIWKAMIGAAPEPAVQEQELRDALKLGRDWLKLFVRETDDLGMSVIHKMDSALRPPHSGRRVMAEITRDEIADIIVAHVKTERDEYDGETYTTILGINDAADAILARLGDGWNPTVGVIGGPYLLYFPATTGRNAQTEFMDVGRLPCPFPRKPSHYISLPSPPQESAP